MATDIRSTHASTVPQTPVAVIGTLAEFHREALPYDLGALVRLVGDLQPDLLCLDLSPAQWQRGDFADLPPEYRDALLPLAHQTDIVVVPIADDRPPQSRVAAGWRAKLVAVLRRWLAALQRSAPDPTAFVEGFRHHIADLLYEVIGLLSGASVYRQWKEYTDYLTRQVLEVARRDPGRRVLVAVNLQHCHLIREALRKHPEVRVVRYSEL